METILEGHHRQAAGRALSLGPVAGLDQVKNPDAPAATRVIGE
jgi:hypothetical protein